MLKKKLAILTMCATVVAGSLTAAGSERPALAESLDQKISNIEAKQRENKQQQASKEDELDAIEDRKAATMSEMEAIDIDIAEANNDISIKEDEVDATEENIARLNDEIEALKARIAERDELLKDRVRSMYKNGGAVSYLDVLFGANSFGDFLERVNALNLIAKQDREILEAHKTDKQAVENKKTEVEEELADLEDQLEQLQSMKASLEKKLSEKQVLVAQLKDQEDDLKEMLTELEASAETLEAQRRAFLEQKRRGSQSSSSGQTVQANSTGFIRPSEGVITSPFGMRTHPISGVRKMHTGVDIAKRGNVPIVAPASGTVISAGYVRGYGNTLFIAHTVNGKQYTTLYGHLRSFTVSEGDYVMQGQQVAWMGNTGYSTGQHLHFEIHPGGYKNPANPLNYVHY